MISIKLVDVLCESGTAVSKSEARRLIAVGSIKVDGTVVDSVISEVSSDVEQIEVGRRIKLKVVDGKWVRETA